MAVTGKKKMQMKNLSQRKTVQDWRQARRWIRVRIRYDNKFKTPVTGK